MSDNLRQRAVRAMAAVTASQWLAKLVSLGTTLVLVRLLTPEDFGLMAIATTVTGLISYFDEIGLGAAIVQRKELRDEEVNGCFGIAMLTSAALCAVTVALSWPAAAFFDSPRLQPVLAVLAFGFFFGALNSVPMALLQRDMRLQATVWIGVTGAIVQSLVAIPLALLGFSYWALVISLFVGQTVSTIWFWRVAGWRPRWPMHLREGLGLLSYGLNVTYTRILWHLYMNADKLIIGKLLGERAVGVYDIGKSLASLPTAQISGLVTKVASPVFSRVQSDMERLQSAFLRFTRGVAYVTFPVLGGMALVAPDLVPVLLGDQWGAAVLPLQALCISEMVRAVANLQSQLLISSGHVARLVKYSTLCAVCLPSAIAAGAWLDGLRGVSIAWAVVYPLLSTWLLREVTLVTGLRYIEVWAAVRAPLLGTLIMAATITGVHYMLLAWSPSHGVLLVAQVGAAALAYLWFLVYADRDGLSEVRQALRDFGVPDARLQRWPFSRLARTGSAE